jgi:hypothetical protein
LKGSLLATKKNKLLLNDGIENLTTGLGSAKDAKAYTEFSETDVTKEEIEIAYRYDWVLAKAVEIPAKDMTKKWLAFTGKSKKVDLVKAEYKRLKVKAVVRKALVHKALYGASYIVIESQKKSLKSALDTNIPIKTLHVHHKFSFKEKSDDIHESRIYTMEQNEFQDPVLLKLKEAILNLLTSLEIPASLMHKADIDFLSIEGLAAALNKCKKSKDCSNAEEKILKRVQTMYEQLSLYKLGIKDSKETYETFTKDLSNYDTLQQSYMQVIAGATDIPMTRFFGIAPKGMNSTGKGDLDNYHESLSASQDEFIEPFLEIINKIIFTSNAVKETGFTFEFAPIKDLSPEEVANVQKIKAETIALFIDELDPVTIAEAVQNLEVFKGIKVVSSEQEE